MSGDFNEKRFDSAKVLSEFIARLRFEDLPENVIDTTKLFIADYFAACFAGQLVNGKFNQEITAIMEHMGGCEEASVLGASHLFPAEQAAFLNAVYAHGADMDDGNRKAMGHVAAHVMSAVFALGQAMGNVTWGEIYTAINTGYEVYNRVAAAVQPGLVHRGFHSTGTAGAVACGAACAKLMGLSEDGIYQAMGIAAIQASGLIIIAESGQACKPLNPANAARTGILSAKLAAAGIRGPLFPLESSKGWFHAMSDKVDTDQITDGLGENFTICESYLKPYPSCRHTHCGIEAAIHLRGEMQQAEEKLEDIRAIRLFLYDNAIQIAGQIQVPETVDEAKFSIHYSFAVSLLTGNYTLEDLEKAPWDQAGKLTEKIQLISDETMEDTAAGIRGTRAEIEMESGRVYQKTVLLPKGDAANPFTWEDMRKKMRACSGSVRTDDQADALTSSIQKIDPKAQFTGIDSLLLSAREDEE